MISFLKKSRVLAAFEFTSTGNRNLLLLKKEDDELVIEKSLESDSLDILKNEIPQNCPVFLIVNSEKVIFKVIESSVEPAKAIQTAFPNLKLDDFYYEIVESDTKTYIAICRKEDVNTILKELEDEGIQIVGFSLGNLVISQLSEIIQNGAITTSNANISFENESIATVAIKTHIEPSSYDINSLQVKNTDILSFAGILSYITQKKKSFSNFEILTDTLKSNFKQKQLFDIGLKIGLGTIFLLLLASFLLFSNYNSKINVLNSEIELNKTYRTSLISLQNNVTKKAQLVKDFSMASSKTSWYLDQLGSSVPSSVLLTEISFQPLSKNTKEDEDIQLELQTILVQGGTNNNAVFSEWVNSLEQQDWIAKVTIQEFGTGKKTTTAFKLLIHNIP